MSVIWQNSRFNFLLSPFKKGENYREMRESNLGKIFPKKICSIPGM